MTSTDRDRVAAVAADLQLAGAKCLLVASTGGHLSQLVRLADRWNVGDSSLWITFDSPQVESLLDGKRVTYVPYVKPRDWRAILRTSRHARRVLSEESFDAVVSTGAGVALAFLPKAARRGIPSYYVESIARISGPSMTGRLLRYAPRVRLRTPHPGWASSRWPAIESVLSVFEAVEVQEPVENPRVFVTLGTIRPYRFDSVIDAVLASGLADDRTTWQLGSSPRDGLPGTTHEIVSSAEFDRLAREADVVVTHGGVGNIMRLVELGVYPVVVPRSAERGEHVDDHQWQAAQQVERHGLGLVAAPQDLTAQQLRQATRFSVEVPTPD